MPFAGPIQSIAGADRDSTKSSRVRGVIYISSSEALAQVDLSMASLWTFAPEMPVLVIGDREVNAHYREDARVKCQEVRTDACGGSETLMARIKPLLAGISPFDESLYVDAHTEFQNSPACGFDMLDRWDMILPESQTREPQDSMAGRAEDESMTEWIGTPHHLYHNTGMFFWRKVSAVAKLFELWAEEWQTFQIRGEQMALLRALLRSEAVYQTVPYTWHCRVGQASTLLHHKFAIRANDLASKDASDPAG